MTNATAEIWQCDAAGNYSEYGSLTSATFLRGVQPVNGSGVASFITVYPGWYQGRATHIHVESMIGNRSVKITQIAFPEDINSAVFASGYTATFTVGVAL